MLGSKLLIILTKFTKKELKKFREYTISPFFNKNERLIILLDIIIEKHPNLDHASLAKRKSTSKKF